jgi:hypothetical protein
MLFPAIFLSFFPVLIAVFVVFDQLVRLEYSAYRKHWEADGKPQGYFWVPTESKAANGWLVRSRSWPARNRRTFDWLFSTPEWMRGDEKARRLVFWLRVSMLTWSVGTAGTFLAFVFLGRSEI